MINLFQMAGKILWKFINSLHPCERPPHDFSVPPPLMLQNHTRHIDNLHPCELLPHDSSGPPSLLLRNHTSHIDNLHHVKSLHMTVQFLPLYCWEITLLTLIISILVNSLQKTLQFLPLYIYEITLLTDTSKDDVNRPPDWRKSTTWLLWDLNIDKETSDGDVNVDFFIDWGKSMTCLIFEDNSAHFECKAEKTLEIEDIYDYYIFYNIGLLLCWRTFPTFW